MWSHVGDRRDQKTLEKFQAERRAKIDELKERTNYYITQQLIQVHTLNLLNPLLSCHKFCAYV